MRYLQRPSSMCLCFGSEKPTLVGFIDANNMDGDIDSRKSTSGYLITFFNGSCILAIKITKVCCIFYH